MEIEQGLMKDCNPARNCAWFHRQINGVNRKLSRECSDVARYVDNYEENEQLYEDPWELQLKLKKRMSDVLPSDGILEYNINWTKNGSVWLTLYFMLLFVHKPYLSPSI